MSTEAGWMYDLLTDPVMTSAILVSLPEDLPVNETLELAQALRTRLKVRVGAVVLNQSVASRFGAADRAALAGRPGLGALVEAYEEDAQRTEESVERLHAIDAPLVQLPRLVAPELGRGELVSLGDALAEALR
jgi:hypothetical protein